MNDSNKTYRIHTNINSDTVLNVHLKQDVDFLEILSLKLKQEDLYKLHTSNYGLVVGRVLANEAFGIPNVKVSIFIPIDENDKENSEIENLYPYDNTSSKNRDGVRYNLLPNDSDDDCFKIVGTFPVKRLLLDENTYIEVFDKYWKYTTVTNKAGDYAIPNVPIGECEIHIDFDISDVGILSQRPRDMIYKGYNNTLFDNANQFKDSTDLDNLAQIFSQNQTFYVYPFWGEEDLNEIAITRCDINVQYKFEPTCIFMGSIVSDTFGTAIGHNCKAFRTSGYNNTLVAGEGTIEMIRKTTDGFIEDFQIQGNRLIDGDGIWCYQIPMNLDYVQTDEYGNIIPTDNPKKGIPTRTSVRFRFTMQETENDGVSRHRAKYLVPNNPKLQFDETKNVNEVKIDQSKYSLESYYEFGTATNEDCYRDLFWNKVYTVKNYIPRIQTSKKAGTKNYTGLRTVNYSEDKNPVPFNKIRFNLSFTYRLSCIIAVIVLGLIWFINKFIIGFWNMVIGWLCKLCIGIWKFKVCPFGFLCRFLIPCIEFPFITESDEGSCATTCYYPGCSNDASQDATKDNNPDCDIIEDDRDKMKNKLEQLLAQENEAVNLDFYNDWLNGTLYMPLWYWKKRRKRKFFFGLFSLKAVNSFCNCDKRFKTKLMWPCAFKYNDNFDITSDLNKKYNGVGRWHDKEYDRITINYGFVKEKYTLSGLRAYYYAPGLLINPEKRNVNGVITQDDSYAFLFATDIVLIGSLNDCDLNGIPQLFVNLPSTTCNIMPINRDVEPICDTEEDSEPIQETTGMDFWTDEQNQSIAYKGNGYFMDIGCSTIDTLPKTCVNAERLSELGIALDQTFSEEIPSNNSLIERQSIADGMITKTEIMDDESRSIFATLNHNGLQVQVYNENIGYYFYKFRYLYPIEFDGRMSKYCTAYTEKMPSGRKTTDVMNRSYLLYRQGDHKYFYVVENNANRFPLYNNSYYFYFGLTEGKTAIDKFNSKFFSQCYQNNKEPFGLKVETNNAKFYTIVNENCEHCSDKLGEIIIKFDNISTPYIYTITNSNGEIVVPETECDREEIVLKEFFDKKYEEGEINKTCIEVDEEKYEQYPIVNDEYTLTVTDSKGKTMTQMIEMNNTYISANIATRDLASKFYEGQTKMDDICSLDDACGWLVIQEIIIDNEVISFTDIPYIMNEGQDNEITIQPTFEKYGTPYIDKDGEGWVISFKRKVVGDEKWNTCTNPNTTLDMIIDIKIIPESRLKIATDKGQIEVKNFYQCICGGIPDKTDIGETDWGEQCSYSDCGVHFGDYKINEPLGLIIPIWIPQMYSLIITQRPYVSTDICNQLINTSTMEFTILNGKPFDMKVNSVLLKFIAGKRHDNGNFIIKNDGSITIPKNKIQDVNNIGSLVPYQSPCETDENRSLHGWFNVFNESKWSFDEYKNVKDNEAYWSEVIEDIMFDVSDNGDECLSKSTKDSILLYKLNSLSDLSSNTYVGSGNENEFVINHTGGRSPIIHKSQLPDYGNITNEESINGIQPIIYSNDDSISCNTTHPTIVSWNYKYYIANDNTWEHLYPLKDLIPYGMNKLFADDKHLGMYFAVFSDNGGMVDNGGACEYEINLYNAAPLSADPSPYIAEGICISDEIETTTYSSNVYQAHSDNRNGTVRNYKPHFRTEFIDRRIDYDLIIMTPYNGDETMIELSPTEYDWTKGRVSGTVINGIELSYDKAFNILGYDSNSDLEYIVDSGNCFDAPSLIYNESNAAKINKRLYSATVKSGVKTIDIKDTFWADDNRMPVNIEIKDFNSDDFAVKNVFAVSKDLSYVDSHTNSVFNEINYPTLRLFDIAHIDRGSEIELNLTSCGYVFQTSYTEGNDKNLNAIVPKGEECEFVTTCDNSLSFKNADLQDCTTNGYGNVDYLAFNNIGVENASTSLFVSGNEVSIIFGLNPDQNTNSNVRTRMPRIIRIRDIKSRDINLNPVRAIKTEEDSFKINDILHNEDLCQSTYIIDKPQNVSSANRIIWHDESEWTYLINTDDNNRIVEDYSQEYAGTTFGVVSERYKIGDLELSIPFKVKDSDFICMCIDREYFNDNNQDFLMKTARVINLTNMFDVRPFIWNCVYCDKSAVVAPPDTGGSGSTYSTYNNFKSQFGNISDTYAHMISSYDDNASFNEINYENTPNITESTIVPYADGEEPPVADSALCQVIVYDLVFDESSNLSNPTNLNQVFKNVKDMSFTIKYNIGGTEYVIDNLVPYINPSALPDRPYIANKPTFTQGTTLRFYVQWNGAMKDLYMGEGSVKPNIPTSFYFKTKQGLVYALFFYHRGLSVTDRYMFS